MPTYAAPRLPLWSLYRPPVPVVTRVPLPPPIVRAPYYPPPVSTLAPPVNPVTRQPLPMSAPVVREHTGGGGCGCGSKHSAAVPVATAEPGTALAVGSSPVTHLGADWTPRISLFTAPADWKTSAQPVGFNMEFLKDVDWARDWWKFAAGALAFKLLSK